MQTILFLFANRKPHTLRPTFSNVNLPLREIGQCTTFSLIAVRKYDLILINIIILGAEQLHLGSEAREKILLDSNNKYKKALQQESPRLPQTWYPLTEAEKRQKRKDANKVKKFEKGLHRWKSLPEPIDVRLLL